jgi:hypothetical protein
MGRTIPIMITHSLVLLGIFQLLRITVQMISRTRRAVVALEFNDSTFSCISFS